MFSFKTLMFAMIGACAFITGASGLLIPNHWGMLVNGFFTLVGIVLLLLVGLEIFHVINEQKAKSVQAQKDALQG